LTWHDAASVRIKCKVPATQRHHRECAARARWLAISEVRFLYGLPTYFTLFVVNKIKLFLRFDLPMYGFVKIIQKNQVLGKNED